MNTKELVIQELKRENLLLRKDPDFYIEKLHPETFDIIFKKLILQEEDRIDIETYKEFCERNSIDFNKDLDIHSFHDYDYIYYINDKRQERFMEYIKLLQLFNKDIFKNIAIERTHVFWQKQESLVKKTESFNTIDEFIEYCKNFIDFKSTCCDSYLYITKNLLEFQINEYDYKNKKNTQIVKMFPEKTIKII